MMNSIPLLLACTAAAGGYYLMNESQNLGEQAADAVRISSLQSKMPSLNILLSSLPSSNNGSCQSTTCNALH
ncbi:hypothetical protein BDV93DRAFT_527453 [Ceratobasidium sp. AG-I]|nr:hypothetical protein BDV93DRAFT_527453 [Ceratobasidium sp. AG-I]